MSVKFLLSSAIALAICATSFLALVSFAKADPFERCAEENADLRMRSECAFETIQSELRSRGIARALQLLEKAVTHSPALITGGCHPATHRVGDMVFYDFSVGNKHLLNLDFPPEVALCGYGFLHGFFEHFFAQHPEALLVNETCDLISARYGDRLFAYACLDGAGHGFLTRFAAETPRDQWGQSSAFLAKPLDECRGVSVSGSYSGDSGPRVCARGVFTTFSESVQRGEYGFREKNFDFLAACYEVPASWKSECIKTLFAYSLPADVLPEDIARSARMLPVSRKVQIESFKNAVGMRISRYVGTSSPAVFCQNMDDDFYPGCIRGMIMGIPVNTNPTPDDAADRLCADSVVRSRGLAEQCEIWSKEFNLSRRGF